MTTPPPLRPPTPLEKNALEMISLLPKSLLYQQKEYPLASSPGQSKTRAQIAFDQAIAAANHPEPEKRLNLWTHVIKNLIDAEFHALYARMQHFQEVQQADPEGWNWKRLEEKISDARIAASMCWHYWRGWCEGQGLPVPELDRISESPAKGEAKPQPLPANPAPV